MVRTESTMLPLGTEAPDFTLPDPLGEEVSLQDVADGKDATLVMFWCNHCPYVQHIRETMAELARDWYARGVGIVAVMSNDLDNYPQDGPEHMLEEAKTFGYVFPYLVDEDQRVAMAYKAACTPDLFLFDGERKLVYRGQFDASRPGSGDPVTGEDLSAAVEAVLAGERVPEPQRPSMGCNIKWNPGNEPDYSN